MNAAAPVNSPPFPPFLLPTPSPQYFKISRMTWEDVTVTATLAFSRYRLPGPHTSSRRALSAPLGFVSFKWLTLNGPERCLLLLFACF